MSAVPFVFLGCIDLKEMLPYEARDVRELLRDDRTRAIESLFCHTRPPSSIGRPCPRDIRTTSRTGRASPWATSGWPNAWPHRPFESRSLEQMREELVATISDHLQHFPAASPVARAEPFRFFQAHLVPVPPVTRHAR